LAMTQAPTMPIRASIQIQPSCRPAEFNGGRVLPNSLSYSPFILRVSPALTQSCRHRLCKTGVASRHMKEQEAALMRSVLWLAALAACSSCTTPVYQPPSVVAPVQQSVAPNQQYCHEFTTPVTVGGRPEQAAVDAWVPAWPEILPAMPQKRILSNHHERSRS
jgi:hypothetical protein